MIASLLLCVSCSSYSENSASTELTLTSKLWQVVSINDEKAIIGANEKPLTIEFLDEVMTYRGFAGCNNFSGKYQLNQPNIKLGPAMATRKMCQLSSDIERKYLKNLAAVDKFELQGNTLTLTDKADNKLLVFTGK